MTWDGIDRRKFPRASYKCLVTVRKKGGVQTFATQTENIGEGGICVGLKERLDIFSNVDLVLTILNGVAPVKCAGTVVWVIKSVDPKKAKSNYYDTGIEFVDLTADNKQKIKKVIIELALRDSQE